VREPPGGPTMEVRNLIGLDKTSAELQAQEIRQEMVIAEPGALGVQRYDERVGVLQLQQRPLRARTARQQVGKFPVQPVDDRRSTCAAACSAPRSAGVR